jgi:hypothetical protein
VEGQVASPDTQGKCCWPNQVWSNSRFACMGIPDCPQGMMQQGPECVAAEPAPEPAPEPMATPAPAPAPDPAPAPAEGAPVPMDAAPVPFDGSAPTYAQTAATPVTLETTQAEKEQENLKRSLWVLGLDFLIDMSSGRFGLRLRTDIPLYRGHWAPQLGFGVGILPPSFIAGSDNTAWAFPLEATVGMRIPLVGNEPRVHLIPRAGVAGHLLVADRGVGFGLKVLIGLSGRVNFGSAFGVNLGFDAMIPAVGPGFVWHTTIGFST